MPEKEICIDLSKKIKFNDKLYISIGSLLLSGIIIFIQLMGIMSNTGWLWTTECWYLLLNFIHSIRAGESHEKKDDDKQ